MAKQPGLDFQSAKGGLGELKRRLLFVIGALIVFRIGSFIPIPGIDATVLAKLLEQQRGTIIEMFNMFSGGALSRASIFALGIMPYISASIIIQLLTVVHPALAEYAWYAGLGVKSRLCVLLYCSSELSYRDNVPDVAG